MVELWEVFNTFSIVTAIVLIFLLIKGSIDNNRLDKLAKEINLIVFDIDKRLKSLEKVDRK